MKKLKLIKVQNKAKATQVLLIDLDIHSDIELPGLNIILRRLQIPPHLGRFLHVLKIHKLPMNFAISKVRNV